MRYKTAFALGIRVVGILTVIEAVPSCIESLSALVERLTITLYPVSRAQYWFWVLVPSSVAFLRVAVGVLLFVGANKLSAYFMLTNRIVCSACAYDLAGLPAVGRCPECGVAYRLDRPAPVDGIAGGDIGAGARRAR